MALIGGNRFPSAYYAPNSCSTTRAKNRSRRFEIWIFRGQPSRVLRARPSAFQNFSVSFFFEDV